MLVMFYKIGKVHYFITINSFHVKAKNGRFTAVGLHCHDNLKDENFMSFGRQPKKIPPKSHVQHHYFSSFGQ